MATTKNELDVSLLRGNERKIAEEIIRAAREFYKEDFSCGGCKAFYSHSQWEERKERFGGDAALIVCHDGGELAPFFNWDYGNSEAVEHMRKALEAIGYYAEQCTNWYTGIYPCDGNDLLDYSNPQTIYQKLLDMATEEGAEYPEYADSSDGSITIMDAGGRLFRVELREVK